MIAWGIVMIGDILLQTLSDRKPSLLWCFSYFSTHNFRSSAIKISSTLYFYYELEIL